MGLGIKTKLFLVITLACTVVVIGMFLLMQWSFDRGFLNYVNKSDNELFEHVHSAVTQEYTVWNNWNFVHRNPRQWHQVIINALPEGNRELGSRLTPPPGQKRPPPGTRPPRLKERGDDNFMPKRKGNKKHRPPPPKKEDGLPPELGELFLRFTLYDADKKHLVGAPVNFDKTTTKPLIYNSQTVGYLGLEPRRELSNTNELQFSEQQADTFALIAIATLLIVACLALPLANHFVRPIKKLKESAQVLASGHYQTRIDHKVNDELGELSKDFNILAKTLEDNENTRQRWIADISHELRTPLSILRGEIEAIIDGVRKTDEKSMNSLHQEVIQLTRLVNDLYELSLSDLGALNYRKSEINISEIVGSSIASFETEFSKKNIKVLQRITDDNYCVISGDKDRLIQLMTNLLKNSLKYTDTGGTVEVKLSKSKEMAIIDIQDSSPGVAAESIPKLFDRLFRVESSRNRALGGAGLGMAIAKNIVDAHQGKIEAKSASLLADYGLQLNYHF